MSHRGNLYWWLIEQKARELGSDGCSAVPDWHLRGCLRHDIHYRTHREWAVDSEGLQLIETGPITRAAADAALRRYIQHHSPLGRASPMALWRWATLRVVGGRAWRTGPQRRVPLDK